MNRELKDRVALVTGGGTGIGKGIADALAAAGARVAITGRRVEVLDSAVRELEDAGGQAVAIAGDVAHPQDAERMVAETVAALGDLHILINNAGIARGGPLTSMQIDDIDGVIDIDLKGPIYVTRAAYPHLERHADNGGAAVINISSGVTQNVVANFSVYSAAKAGLDMLTRCWALDFAERRVCVNGICCGVVETPIFATMMPEAAVSRAMRQFSSATPLGRVGQPADIARVVRFLADPASDWITGAILTVDGGLSLGG